MLANTRQVDHRPPKIQRIKLKNFFIYLIFIEEYLPIPGMQ